MRWVWIGAALAAACADTSGTDDVVDTSVDEPRMVDVATLDALLADGLANNEADVAGLALVVVDSETDRELYRRVVGDFDTDDVVPIGSASKLVSGLVLARLATSGTLAPTSTTGDVLGWSGARGDITLDHLGAFTSGMSDDAPCITNPDTTLQACVRDISALPRLAAPGERFDYGPTHHAVAGRMAEVSVDLPWNTIVDELFKAPLGLDDPDQTYATVPKQPDTVGANPLVAGGFQSSMNDFLPILRLVDDRGRQGGTVFIGAALIDRMFQNRYVGAELGAVPGAAEDRDWRYGWSAWLECEGAVDECDVISSPGAYGFTPWVDREHGYYAILAMESPTFGGGAFAVTLEKDVQDALVEALSR